jgi:hypothetical protein
MIGFEMPRTSQKANVIAPLGQIPAFLRAIVTSTVAAVIQVDDLNEISQGGVGRLVDRVIEAEATMKEKQCWLLLHGGTVRDQSGAINVEE